MLLSTNKEKSVLYIKDNSVFHRNGMYLIFSLNILNTILNCLKVPYQNYSIEQFVWIGIAAFSVFSIIYIVKTKSFCKEIKTEKIRTIRFKAVSNGYTLLLKLDNGKQRDITIRHEMVKEKVTLFLINLDLIEE